MGHFRKWLIGKDKQMINWKKYNPSQQFNFLKSSKSHKNKIAYLSEPICLDTETSWNHDEARPIGWVYQWAFAFGNETVTGRKPSQLVKTLQKIVKYYGANESNKIICLVHNLSYDIQYLKHYIANEFGEWRILATANHKIITFESGPLLFKCTYFLSNRSLAKWGKDLFITQRKKENLIDYDVIRYQDTPLSNNDDLYMEYDVLALQECFKKQLSIYNDDITSVVLTATGYVRRAVRKKARADRHELDRFLASKLTLELYNKCKFCFAGGYTHGNRHKASETIKMVGNDYILHRDFTSHYPTQQLCKKYPVGPWFQVINPQIEDIEKWKNRGYCLIIEFAFENCELKDRHEPFPFMQVSKVQEGKKTKIDTIEDNGRIMALNGIVVLVATEIDFEIYQEQYKFGRIKILNLYRSASGYLPKWLTSSILEFFEGKTKYKELAKVESDPEKKADYLISLMKSKNNLNGIYGMSATSLIRQTLVMDDSGEWFVNNEKSEAERLEEYYNSLNSFMSYQFGLYCTSHARAELYRAMKIIKESSPLGYDAIFYCDTDSLFYQSCEETEKAFAKWNDELLAEAERRGAFAEYNGKKVYMNQFLLEDEKITHFRFLHSKCYCYITDDREMHATIAGVPAKSKDGKITREKELGNINNLKAGFTFEKCGGSRIIYTERKPSKAKINGHTLEISSSACITSTTKQLGELPFIGLDYDTALEGMAEEGKA